MLLFICRSICISRVNFLLSIFFGNEDVMWSEAEGMNDPYCVVVERRE